MMENYLLKGIFIGIMFGVPVGVVGVMTVQRTLTKGFLAGLMCGLGSSFADIIYASISIFGITMIADFLLKYQQIICVLGCILIIGTGIHMLKKETLYFTESQSMKSSSSFFSSLIITLTNPAAILSFMVIFSTFGVNANSDLFHKILLVLGIFIGTALWWLGLSAIVNYHQNKISDHFYRGLNKCFGIAIIVLGIFIAGYSFVRY